MVRASLCLTAFVLLPAAASPHPPQREAPSPAASTASVSGRVIAADTGAPIRDSVVSLTTLARNTTSPTRTDDDGRFAFTGLPAGRYRLRVAIGPASARYLEDEQVVELGDGQVLDRLVVRLRRAGAIAGRVLDEYGDPIAFAMIRVYRLEGGRPREFAGRVGFGSLAITDDEGRFRVFGLAPGDYVLAAAPSAAPDAAGAGVPSKQVVTYFPGTASITDAAPINVAAGEEVAGLQWPILRSGTFKIVGSVVDSRGEPLPGVWVSARERKGFGGSGVMTLLDGTFTIRNVVAGEYFLLVRPQLPTKDLPPDAELAVQPLAVSGDVEGILLATRRGATLTGSVTFDPASGAPLARAGVTSVAIDDRMRPTGLPPTSPVADDGTFRLTNVFGPVLVRVTGATGWALDSVTRDGQDITDVATDFGSGMSGIRIAMTKRGAALAGAVQNVDGTQAPKVRVLVFAENESAWHLEYSTTRSTMTEPDGRYSIEAVRPGTYYVVALLPEDMPAAASGGDGFAGLAKQATKVELRDGQTRALDLRLSASRR